MEAHGHGLQYAYHPTKQALMMETERPIALREAIMACRIGGITSARTHREGRKRPVDGNHPSDAVAGCGEGL